MSRASILILLLLSIGSLGCVAPEGSDGRELPEDAATLLARADGHFDGRAYENAQRLYELAALAARAEEDDGRFVEAASQVAHVRALAGEAEQAREWLDSATERVQREDPAAWARWLVARGAVEQAEGRTERARATFEEAHAFARGGGLHVRAVQAAHWASVVAPPEEAPLWSRRAIEAAEPLERPDLSSALWSNLGWLLEERGLHDEALEAFRRARAVADPRDGHAQLVADWAVGHGLRLAGRLDEARVLLEDVTRRSEAAYVARRRPNDAEWVAHAYSELAELDAAAGEVERALARLEVARERFLEAGARRLAPARLAAVEERLAQLREAQGSSRSGPR